MEGFFKSIFIFPLEYAITILYSDLDQLPEITQD